MSTPAHIVPEWYFLPVYAILRSIPNKLGGVLAIGLVFVCLFALPFLNTSYVRSSSFRPIHKKLFWLFVADCLLLGWIGSQPVEAPYVTIGQIASLGFFLYFALIPVLGKLETNFIYNSHSELAVRWLRTANTHYPRIFRCAALLCFACDASRGYKKHGRASPANRDKRSALTQ